MRQKGETVSSHGAQVGEGVLVLRTEAAVLDAPRRNARWGVVDFVVARGVDPNPNPDPNPAPVQLQYSNGMGYDSSSSFRAVGTVCIGTYRRL